ncbi:MAG: PIN domain-containing protein [Candidatus Dormibacteria bacterium]
MLRAVVDTNVLVSAVVAPSGVCGRLVASLSSGTWTLVLSPMLVEELTSVLGRPKFAALRAKQRCTLEVVCPAMKVRRGRGCPRLPNAGVAASRG